jgi:hypothetical protein
MKKLTNNQIAFCNNILELGPDGARSMPDYQAYLLAYPNVRSEKSAMAAAARLLKQDNIQLYLTQRRHEVEAAVNKKIEISKERILEEEGYIAFHDIGQLFNPDTGEFVEPHKLPEDIRRAIASIKVKETEIAGVKTKTWEIKINDKGRSLDRLEKCFGMQRDKLDVDAVITIKGLLEEIDGKDRNKLPIEME